MRSPHWCTPLSQGPFIRAPTLTEDLIWTSLSPAKVFEVLAPWSGYERAEGACLARGRTQPRRTPCAHRRHGAEKGHEALTSAASPQT